MSRLDNIKLKALEITSAAWYNKLFPINTDTKKIKCIKKVKINKTKLQKEILSSTPPCELVAVRRVMAH